MLRGICIALLCLGVFLQMMGAPISFWDLTDSGDDFVSAVVMGFAILPSALQYCPGQFSHVIALTPSHLYEFLGDLVLFRPPVSLH